MYTNFKRRYLFYILNFEVELREQYVVWRPSKYGSNEMNARITILQAGQSKKMAEISFFLS